MQNNSYERKNLIIDSLKNSLKHNVEAYPLPDLSEFVTMYEQKGAELLEQFGNSLKSVGGEMVVVSNLNSAKEEIEKIYNQKDFKIASLVSGIELSTFDVKSITDPHELNGLDLAIIPGRFGVSENGAIWVDGSDLSHRALIAIPENLIIVINASDLLPTMHQAYLRVGFGGQAFGAFISGPSKTADIEQSLVIGAQGARAMKAFVINSL